MSSNVYVNNIFKDLPKADNNKCMYINGDYNFTAEEVEIYKVIPNWLIYIH